MCKKTRTVAGTITTQGTVLWQLCLASVKPAGAIQVSLAATKTILENSIKFKTKIILLKYTAKLTQMVTLNISTTLLNRSYNAMLHQTRRIGSMFYSRLHLL